VWPIMLPVTAAFVGEILIFFVALLLLLSRRRLRHTVVGCFEGHEASLHTLKIMNDIEHKLIRYLSIALIRF
jgi:hypothetical protein